MIMFGSGLMLVPLLLRRMRKGAAILAIATAAVTTTPPPAAAAKITTYQVAGVIGACYSASDDICPSPNPPPTFHPTLPVFGAFEFDFDLGGAGYPTGAAGEYVGGSDFNSSFIETLGFGATPAFSIDATYPVPGNDGFPGFDYEEAVTVIYQPSCPPGTCAAGIPATDSALLVQIVLLNNSVAYLNLYFQSGNPVTGDLDAIYSNFEIITYQPSATLYSVDSVSARVASTTPEPATAALLGIPLLWLLWRRQRA
jgi:hypothetical protein